MVISGGQSGVDRAALDVAIHLVLAHGGWCPRGRIASDGPIDARYLLHETESSGYRQRTKANVVTADATLIISTAQDGYKDEYAGGYAVDAPVDIHPAKSTLNADQKLVGGSALTLRLAKRHQRPHLVVHASTGAEHAILQIRTWLNQIRPICLNVAGSSEERHPGAYAFAEQVLFQALRPTLPGDPNQI